jgi:DNA-binding phage protein
MSDVNRFLSGVMEKTTVNRPVLARALRMETVPAIIDIFTVMYTEAVQAVPQDGKKLDRVQKILTSI